MKYCELSKLLIKVFNTLSRQISLFNPIYTWDRKKLNDLVTEAEENRLRWKSVSPGPFAGKTLGLFPQSLEARPPLWCWSGSLLLLLLRNEQEPAEQT